MTDERLKRLETYVKQKGELLGFIELSQVLGISKQNLANWMKREKLPQPDHKLAATSCWRAATIQRWLKKQAKAT